jgi:alpha-galactosidase
MTTYRTRALGAAILMIYLALPQGASAVVMPTPSEMNQAQQWGTSTFDGSQPFFSFTYNGKSSSELLGTWDVARSSRALDDHRTERTLTYTDPQTKLEVRCVGIEYNDYPTVEWTLYFKNAGASNTPILENIQALDVQFNRSQNQGEYVLHHNKGTPYSASDYQPIDTSLSAGTNLRIGAAGGRPMNTDMPYFNLEWGGQGVVAAIGWTGQWTSQWTRDNAGGLRVSSGQENTHFKLLPGEEVRSPLVTLQFYQGDAVRSQNIWRRWMITHNLPQPGDKPMPPVFSAAGADLFPNLICGAADEIPLLKSYPQRGLNVDYWWRDAGWYPCGNGWWNTGTWEPDPVRYPKGLGEVADAAHANGMKFTVWFEPERVTAGS